MMIWSVLFATISSDKIEVENIIIGTQQLYSNHSKDVVSHILAIIMAYMKQIKYRQR